MKRSPEGWENIGRRQMSRRGMLIGGAKVIGAAGVALALESCQDSVDYGPARPEFTLDKRQLVVDTILTEAVRNPDPKNTKYRPDLVASAMIIAKGRQHAANEFGTAVMSMAAYAGSGTLPSGITVLKPEQSVAAVYHYGVVDTEGVPGYTRGVFAGVNRAVGNYMDDFVFGVDRGKVPGMPYGGSSRLIIAQLSASTAISNLDFQDATNWGDKPDIPEWPEEEYPAGLTDDPKVLDAKAAWEKAAFAAIRKMFPALPHVALTSDSPSGH